MNHLQALQLFSACKVTLLKCLTYLKLGLQCARRTPILSSALEIRTKSANSHSKQAVVFFIDMDNLDLLSQLQKESKDSNIFQPLLKKVFNPILFPKDYIPMFLAEARRNLTCTQSHREQRSQVHNSGGGQRFRNQPFIMSVFLSAPPLHLSHEVTLSYTVYLPLPQVIIYCLGVGEYLCSYFFLELHFLEVAVFWGGRGASIRKHTCSDDNSVKVIGIP